MILSFITQLLLRKKFGNFLLTVIVTLIVGTGALFSPTFVQQKKEIPVVAHAIELSREDDK